MGLILGVCIKFGANPFINSRLTDFKMAAAAILNLLPVSISTTREVYFMSRTLC